jgi:hypothetical protein
MTELFSQSGCSGEERQADRQLTHHRERERERGRQTANSPQRDRHTSRNALKNDTQLRNRQIGDRVGVFVCACI